MYAQILRVIIHIRGIGCMGMPYSQRPPKGHAPDFDDRKDAEVTP
jgi:hypothetical protein